MLENTFRSAQGSLRPGNSATNPNHGFTLSALARLQTVKSGPARSVLKSRPDLPQKMAATIKFSRPQKTQEKRPGGSELASGGGVTEIIDCNQMSYLTTAGVVHSLMTLSCTQYDIVSWRSSGSGEQPYSSTTTAIGSRTTIINTVILL